MNTSLRNGFAAVAIVACATAFAASDVEAREAGSAAPSVGTEGEFCCATIDGTFTGAWFDPAQSGHGLFIEILPDNGIQAAWFTFNPAGTEQAWFLGTGTYAGNTATLTSVVQPSGGRWIPNFDPKRVAPIAWGTITLTFSSCDHGKVDFVSSAGYGMGSMNVTRLTQPLGLTCQ
jgi:hypothetical protein